MENGAARALFSVTSFMYIDTGRTLCNVYQLSVVTFRTRLRKLQLLIFLASLHETKCVAACNEDKVDCLSDVPCFRYIFLERIKFNLYLLYWFQID